MVPFIYILDLFNLLNKSNVCYGCPLVLDLKSVCLTKFTEKSVILRREGLLSPWKQVRA
uniref:Uncharacterized protein n=1 Tax=Phlebia radiata TaxID=5308 RepID=L8B9A8_PHLRA|nr:hypothetical protein PRA_mt0097 [Phlebia radiata]CCE89201.1 hypothetical protein PRA_mt0097 [Phlebia radiata]